MSLVSAFGMLYLYLLLNLSDSLIPSRERNQVALFIVFCSWKSRLVSVSSTIEGQMFFVIFIVVCCRKDWMSISSFACWNCPLPQTCFSCAYRHCRLVFIGMLFLYSLMILSASLLPSIERQVALFIVVCSRKSRCPCHHQ